MPSLAPSLIPSHLLAACHRIRYLARYYVLSLLMAYVGSSIATIYYLRTIPKLYWLIRSISDMIILQNAINHLIEWCRDNGLLLNPAKCASMVYSKKLNPICTNYTINGSPMGQENTYRDLGINFDTKLKFINHIDQVTNNAYKMLSFIMRTTQNFNNRKCINMLYTLVRSQFEYKHTLTMFRGFKGNTLDIFIINAEFNMRNMISDWVTYLSLRSRRVYFDMRLLHHIVHRDCLGTMPEKLSYKGTNYSSRNSNLFNSNTSRMNYGMHMDIINRQQLCYI